MSRSYNKHKKYFYVFGLKNFKNFSNKARRAHIKRLIDTLKKTTNENIDTISEVFEGGNYREIVGEDSWDYD